MDDHKLEILDKMDPKIEERILDYASHPAGGLFELLEDIVYVDDLEAFKAVFENGGNINLQNKYGWTPLHIAIRRGRADMARYLIDRGADLNKKDGVGWTPLMESIMDDMPELCKMLLDAGADTSIANDRGATAAMLVQKFGRTSMMGMF
ncbi:MAG: ankyrin repeat domain-containing protein [Campylobacterales bacterium]|jgi:ankyrin repeat protein